MSELPLSELTLAELDAELEHWYKYLGSTFNKRDRDEAKHKIWDVQAEMRTRTKYVTHNTGVKNG